MIGWAISEIEGRCRGLVLERRRSRRWDWPLQITGGSRSRRSVPSDAISDGLVAGGRGNHSRRAESGGRAAAAWLRVRARRRQRGCATPDHLARSASTSPLPSALGAPARGRGRGRRRGARTAPRGATFGRAQESGGRAAGAEPGSWCPLRLAPAWRRNRTALAKGLVVYPAQSESRVPCRRGWPCGGGSGGALKARHRPSPVSGPEDPNADCALISVTLDCG